jgi:hypothetical protein
MNFPDMKSLERAASGWSFRKINDGESESDYRNALADFVKPKDFIESHEIRTGKGWDEWTDSDNMEMLRHLREAK